MNDLLAARSQMGMSLAFHIIFAVIGMAMPVLMVLAEWRYRMSGDVLYLELAKRWSRGTAILFAVGAVSGTVLAFELGLLWPRFMAWAGGIIGMPFSLEGFAFFLEAIFLGIYLYGWKRVSPGAHLLAGVVVALSGTASAIFVTTANAWMNTPAGFSIANGRVVNVSPLAAMLNPAAFSECLHMTIAAYAATGFAVAGIHALMLLRGRNRPFHSRALGIALMVGGVASVLQLLTGDVIARAVARNQPLKLAAFEGLYKTQAAAPLQVAGGLEIPAGLSLLGFHNRNAIVEGLEDFPRDQWPPVHILRAAFLIMVIAGFLTAGVAC